MAKHGLSTIVVKNGLISDNTTHHEKNQEVKTNTDNELSPLGVVTTSAVGHLAGDRIKNFFTKEENKPATKQEIYNLHKKLDEVYTLLRELCVTAYPSHFRIKN